MPDNEPSYLAFARANVRDGWTTSPQMVRCMLELIDRLTAENAALRKGSTK